MIFSIAGIDCICSTARFFLGATPSDAGRVRRIPDVADSLSGAVAPDWPRAGCQDLLGRCLDLKHAYKQLVRHPRMLGRLSWRC